VALPRDLTRFESVRRWLEGVRLEQSSLSPRTVQLYLWSLRLFCEFAGKDPDELIRERLGHMRSGDPELLHRHDELLREFAEQLRSLGMAPKTVASAVAAVKSFYRHNYGGLVFKVPRAEVVRRRDIPTREEVRRVLDSRDVRLWVKAWIVAQCQSGLSLRELKEIDPRALLGMIESEEPPLVVPMYRRKEHVEHHCVFGSNSVEILREYIEGYQPRGQLFPYSDRGIQLAVKRAFELAGVRKYITPHSFRRFFSTTLKMVARTGDVRGLSPELIEYWMGHALNPTLRAYFVPPVEEQKRIYREVEPHLSFW